MEKPVFKGNLLSIIFAFFILFCLSCTIPTKPNIEYDGNVTSSFSKIVQLNPVLAKEILKLPDQDKLEKYYLYYSVLGELYSRSNKKEEAKMCFNKAIELTDSETEKVLLNKKISLI